MRGLGAAMRGRRGRWCGLYKVRGRRRQGVEGLATREWFFFVNHGKSCISHAFQPRWCSLCGALGPRELLLYGLSLPFAFSVCRPRSLTVSRSVGRVC